MSTTNSTYQSVVEDVLGPRKMREIWTGNYTKALPLSVQSVDLSAVFPAVFYMFRFGQRRGTGKFLEKFGHNSRTAQERRGSTTIERVASILAECSHFDGFLDETGQAILGDMLLSFCLENVRRDTGRNKQVQRVTPAHYMASWVDLPESVANLRFVPEMLVAMLANQDGEFVEQNRDTDRTWFAVGKNFDENVLLKPFHRGIRIEGEKASRRSDRFDESVQVGLEQLLMIRLAQQLESAPDKLRGGDGNQISNQRPIAEKASREFSEDVRRFIRVYGETIPRHSFVDLLESCMAVGLFTILTSLSEILFAWEESGNIQELTQQRPAYLLVDCSNGVAPCLKTLSEQSFDDFMRRIEHLPVILMALRLLDQWAHSDPKIKKLEVNTRPYATEWINLLGDILLSRREEAAAIFYDLELKAADLAEGLHDDHPEAAKILQKSTDVPNPVWRLAESLTLLQGRKNIQTHLKELFDSILLVGRPNGIAAKSARLSLTAEGTRKKKEVRSLVFTDSVLDYLVHLHVLPSGNRHGTRPLSFKDFIQKLYDRYGFCIDKAPPGMSISNDILQLNRAILERRLRDLGLLVGVNDAEAMKRLRPRFDPVSENKDDLD